MALAQARRVCLITSAPISYNPRLVKEAAALQEAGIEVSVVGPLTDQRRAEWLKDSLRARLGLLGLKR